MNKKISTPIAIGIILVLAILVGGFTLWQYGEIDKEESNIPEAQLPEKEEVANEIDGWRTYIIELPLKSCRAMITYSCNSPEKISFSYPKNWDLEPGSADEPGSLAECPYICKKGISKKAFHVGCFSLGHYELKGRGFPYDRLEEEEVFYNNIQSTKSLFFRTIDSEEALEYISIEIPFNDCDFVFESDLVNTIYKEFNSESDKLIFIDEMEKILNTIKFID